MKCMYCGCLDSKVVDSRLNEDGTTLMTSFSRISQKVYSFPIGRFYADGER